jgi:catechol 2,3-dioxygenase-like lactoylglutathione lyase family enzyme
MARAPEAPPAPAAHQTAIHSSPDGDDRMHHGESLPVFYSSVPQLACRDLDESVAYYRDILGFDLLWERDEPVPSACMIRDHVRIFLSSDPELASRVRGQEFVLFVDEVDRLYEEHLELGAEIISDIHEQPDGFRGYALRDCNGYFLRVAQGADELLY